MNKEVLGGLLRRERPDRITYIPLPKGAKGPFLLKDFKDRDRDIIEMYLQGVSLQKVADELGISYSTVQRTVSKIKSHVSTLYLHNFEKIILQSQNNKFLAQELIKQIMSNDIYDGEFEQNKKGQWTKFKPSRSNPHWTCEVSIGKNGKVTSQKWKKNDKLLGKVLMSELVVKPEVKETIKAMQEHQYNQAMLAIANTKASEVLEQACDENPELKKGLSNIIDQLSTKGKLKVVEDDKHECS